MQGENLQDIVLPRCYVLKLLFLLCYLPKEKSQHWGIRAERWEGPGSYGIVWWALLSLDFLLWKVSFFFFFFNCLSHFWSLQPHSLIYWTSYHIHSIHIYIWVPTRRLYAEFIVSISRNPQVICKLGIIIPIYRHENLNLELLSDLLSEIPSKC